MASPCRQRSRILARVFGATLGTVKTVAGPGLVLAVITLLLGLTLPNTLLAVEDTRTASAADRAQQIATLFPRATRVSPPQDHIQTVYQLDQEIGYVFESNDFVDLKGFSGDRINLLIGLSSEGSIADTIVLHHHEPIFLHGLGPRPLQDFIGQYRNHPLARRVVLDGAESGHDRDKQTAYFDGVTKATVSVIVVNDTILSSAKEVARRKLPDFAQRPPARAKPDLFSPLDWPSLLSSGLIKRWQLTQTAFSAALGHPLDDYQDTQLALAQNTFTLYYTYLNSPNTGRNLLGDQDFARLEQLLDDGDHAIAVMSEGFFDFMESAYRPGAIPERLGLSQHGLPITLRDLNFFHMSAPTLPPGAESLGNIRVFKIRPQAGFNPSEPMQLSLNINLRRNHLMQDHISLSDTFQLPGELFDPVATSREAPPPPLWLTVWQNRWDQVLIIGSALLLLTLGFSLQRRWLPRARHFHRLRWGFLLFTLFYLGIYAQGQLSVVNIIALLLALLKGFDITVFLLDPVIFILWSYTAASLIIWGRGVFCGWLCPFGVMQELAAALASALGIRQWQIKTGHHRRLIRLKYALLIGLVGLSLHSLSAAEKMAEVEPFKTAVTLVFMREWPFVVYALALLAIGLFIHKFYCRYLCPLGAGLAILGQLRRLTLLDRREDCGRPCQLCRHRCGINAIDRRGNIDYNECIQCLECVVILHDPKQCAPQLAAGKQRQRHTAALPLVELAESDAKH